MEIIEKMTRETAQAEFEKWVYETKKLRPVAVEKTQTPVEILLTRFATVHLRLKKTALLHRNFLLQSQEGTN